MRFQHLLVAAVLCLVLLGGSNAREFKADEDNWKAVFPNTPIPNTLQELLKSSTEDAEIDNLPKKNKELQYIQNFFLQHDLHPGKTVDLVINSIPFLNFYHLQSLRDLNLKDLNFEDMCVRKPMSHAEDKYCAKNLGELIGFAISKLGKNIEMVSSSFIDNQTKYTIEGVQKIGDKSVSCHKAYSPAVVIVCHEIKETIAYKVPMVAANGAKIHAIVVCHFDTSIMHPDMLYELLKIKPGTEAACHFIDNESFLLVPNLDLEDPYRINLAIN